MKMLFTPYEVELMRYELEKMSDIDIISEHEPLADGRFEDIHSMSDEEVVEEMLEEMSAEELAMWVDREKYIRLELDEEEDGFEPNFDDDSDDEVL